MLIPRRMRGSFARMRALGWEVRRMTSSTRGHRTGLALLLAACGGDGGVLPDGASVLPGVPSVVFVKRAYVRADGTHDVTGGMGQVFDYDRYVPGDGAG